MVGKSEAIAEKRLVAPRTTLRSWKTLGSGSSHREQSMCPVSLGFRTPLDPTIIWRYMPLSTFETFVQSSGLWFAAASSFPDPFEGTKAAAEASARDRLWDRLGVSEEQRETIRGLTDWNRQ